MSHIRPFVLTCLGLGLTAVSMGTAHACQVPKSDYKNVSCTAQAGVFLASKDDGSPVALLDNKGKKTADLFRYQAVLGAVMGDGLLPVQLNGKVGYINRAGKVALTPNFDRMPTGSWARGVHDGRIVVRKNGAFGVVTTQGRTVVNFDKAISNITDFQNGVATVTRGNQRYQIDTAGQRLPDTPNVANNVATNTTATANPAPVQPPSYTRTISPPASVSITQTSSNLLGTPTTVPVESTVSPAFVSSTTITPITQTPSTVTTRTVNNAPQFFPQQNGGKWGFVDNQGVAMIQYAFDEVKDYSENMAAVRVGDRWGFIDNKGDLVIDFRFTDSGIVKNSTSKVRPLTPLKFVQGKAWIGNLVDGTKMCINTQGVSVSCG